MPQLCGGLVLENWVLVLRVAGPGNGHIHIKSVVPVEIKGRTGGFNCSPSGA